LLCAPQAGTKPLKIQQCSKYIPLSREKVPHPGRFYRFALSPACARARKYS
jgi:hypothetical protein